MFRTLSMTLAITLAYTAHAAASDAVVSGEMAYRGKGPLQFTVDTTATVSIVEVNDKGEAVSSVATASRSVKELPSPFEVKVDPKKLQAGHDYRVQVELKQKDKLISSQKDKPAALTDGKPAKDVRVVLGLK